MEHDHQPTEPEHDPRAAAEAFLRHRDEIDQTEGVLAACRYQEAVLGPLPAADIDAAIALYTGLATSADPEHRVLAADYIELLYSANKAVGTALWLNLLEDTDHGVRWSAYDSLETAVEEERMSEAEAEPFDATYQIGLLTNPPVMRKFDPASDQRRLRELADYAAKRERELIERLEREFDGTAE